MSSIKGTPSYWKQFLYDVLAMVKKLGIATFFYHYHVQILNGMNLQALYTNLTIPLLLMMI